MAPKNNKPAAKPATVAKAAQPKVDPTTLSTTEIYSGEQERQAAIADVTRLRREFDTTTAKGAAAFAKSPEAQAALARLDKAKSAVGMRTSAQDLQALNTVQGQGQTKALNQPSQQYFQSVYSRGEMKPLWEAPPASFKKETVDQWLDKGYDIKDSYFTWTWDKKSNQWKVQALGSKYVGPIGDFETAPLDSKPTINMRLWQAGKIDLSGWLKNDSTYGTGTSSGIMNQLGQVNGLDEIVKKYPNLTYKEFIATMYEGLFGKGGVLKPDEFIEIYEQIFGAGK